MPEVSLFRLYSLRAVYMGDELDALPAWQSGTMDDAIASTALECAVVIIIPLAQRLTAH